MKQKSIILFLCLMVALGGRAQTSTKEVTLKTTAGDIRIALYDETPLHRDNFLKLARMHVYDSLLFHRVIKEDGHHRQSNSFFQIHRKATAPTTQNTKLVR